MARTTLVFTIALTFVAGTACRGAPEKPAAVLAYPPTAKGEVVDDYHGTKVADPYRWMESLDSPEVARWVAAQNAVTNPYLAALPRRAGLRDRLTALWNYARVSMPTERGGRLFYTKNTGLQRQAPVFMRSAVDSPATMVLDPNAISENGSVALAQYTPSPDAKLLAYGLSEGGADWQTIHVRDVATGKDLADEIRWMRFSEIAWTKDGKGFFYSRYPEPPAGKALEAALSGHALYYHRVGTAQSGDRLVYERKDLPAWVVIGQVTEDGRYLLVALAEGAGNKNRLYYADLGNPMAPNVAAPVTPVVEADDAEYWPIGNQGPVLILRTDKDAKNRQVVAVDVRDSSPARWKTVVPPQKQALEHAAVVGGQVVAQYLDVQSWLRLFGLDGTDRGEIPLSGVGSVGAVGGREDAPDVWYSFSSPTTPSTVYRYDPVAKSSEPFEPPQVPADLRAYETKAMSAPSKDGTRIPFVLTAKKGLALDGSHPTMLYGYGGFSVSTLPTYRQD
jgi:prolyl oligopeptidase